MAITRFIVMATLQAARAYVLGMDRDTAYSWGLNRSIFYAAAKRGFKSGYSGRGYAGKSTTGEREEPESSFKLGDELAYSEKKDGKQLFVIGGKAQTPSDFERQIVSRFGGKFQDAWNEAIKIVKEEDKENLLSQRKFYEDVYKPRRDALSKKWSEMTSQEKGAEKTSSFRKARVKVKAG
jgi:hypothetical protein